MKLLNKNMFSLLTAMCFAACASCTDTTLVQVGDYDNTGGGSGPSIEESQWEVKPIAPLGNPDRGYHLECRYFADNLVNPFAEREVYPIGFVDDREKEFSSQDGSTKLVQQYIYLSKYAMRDIDEQGLQNIQKIFDGLREHGYKAVLRFAYNWWGENQYNANWREEEEQEPYVYRHIEQLAPVLQKNIGLIAVMQAGFIGRWGEWHNTTLATNQVAKNKIVSRLLAAIAEPYNIEMRYPTQKNDLTLEDEKGRSRLGYANDYFTAGEHSLASGNDFVPGDVWYNQVLDEAHNVYISGEMPYAEESEWGLHELINRNVALMVFRDHHYSAFDITQNYGLNIRSWKNSRITPSELNRSKILFDESYFLENGVNVARTYYDFVRDHLGYRINVKNVELNAGGGNLTYKIELTNTGFATIMNPKEVYLVLIPEGGDEVKELVKLDVNPKDWQPYDVVKKDYKVLTHTLEGVAETAGLAGKYKVGIWMPEVASNLKYNADYAVKFAVSEQMTPWSDDAGRYAVNIVGEISF
ncbi:DUF4874 domain-containing protein [Bacteroides acidifaciens]|uniref:DUF4874 domain-containing protein n=1 Tax=Bacteroides acidifaciens TaxID=85831 RepID=UPI002149CFD9|nr:DUF4874 domain-containing protein [Bacteroides acidifaciens]MCR2004824.1 DUF4874 domain-containing protein [Bacteroides acidifaciens]